LIICVFFCGNQSNEGGTSIWPELNYIYACTVKRSNILKVMQALAMSIYCIPQYGI